MRNVSAAQLVPILRPLIPQYGHLAAYPSANILIISDRANNVNRMLRIIQRIDQASDSDIEVIGAAERLGGRGRAHDDGADRRHRRRPRVARPR